MRLNNVVLPAPFGPMISRRSPGITVKRDVLRRRQSAEALAEAVDDERRRHSAGSAAGAGVFGLLRFAKLLPKRAAARAPARSGMKMMTTMKIAPSSEFQRST